MKNFSLSLFLMLFVAGTAFSQISGERIIPSTDYPNLQTIADSLNLHGVGSGGVSFMLQGGSSFEESPLVFNTSGTEDNPVYIGWDGQGQKPTVTINGTEANNDAGMSLVGVDYYTIDGIEITNPNSNLEIGILITNANGEDGANHNTIKNVDITLDKLNESQTVGILVTAENTATEIDGNNSHNKFYNNRISNVTIGYNFDGATSNTSLMAVGNEVGTTNGGVSEIFDIVMAGVVAKDQNGFAVRNTHIYDLTRLGDGNTAPAGISTASGNPSDDLDNPFIIENNIIEDLTSSTTSIYGMYLSARKNTYYVNNNKIHNITATGGGGNTADGIMVLATGVEANIYNNMVSGIAAPASALNGNAASRGICVRTFERANVFYNTVLLDYEATNAAHHSAAFIIFNNPDPVLMQNNIFINKTTLPEGSNGVVAAVYKRTPAIASIDEETNNNIYYAGTPGENHYIFYGHNNTAPAALQTLEDYKAFAENFDQNSFTEDVAFLANDDLHIDPSSNSIAKNNGIPVTSPFEITTDYDGTTRDATTPDIGADEIASEFPIAAINPTPEDGAESVAIELSELSWEFHTTPEYTTPEAFFVFFGETPDFDNAVAIATIMYEEGVTNYSAELSEDLDWSTQYYWMVAPTTHLNNGNFPEEITTWTFTTEDEMMYLYPNPAVNPTPANGSVIAYPESDELILSWEFYPEENYVLPTHFNVYGSSSTTGEEWDTPIAQVEYEEGVTSYETIIQLTLPTQHFSLENLETNYWRVEPADLLTPTPLEEIETWTFQFDSEIGLSEIEIQNTVVYPNPAKEHVSIKPAFEGQYEIRLFDMQGKMVANYGYGEGMRTLPITNVQSGIYQMVITKEGVRFAKLIAVN